jgi:hypothetical protein
MRHTIETAPRDGKVVILEHDPTGTYAAAHWSAQTGEWVFEDGEPSKITPTHWRPMPHEKYRPQENAEPSNSSQSGPSPRTRRLVVAGSIAAALIASVLIRLYLDYEPATRSPREDTRKTESLALRQAGGDQAAGQARTQAAVRSKPAVEAAAPQRRQSSEKEPPREAVMDDLSEARRAIEGLNVQLKAEAANHAQLLDQERQKAAALAQEAAAARQALTTSTQEHRQPLDEERAHSAALASELAAARLEIEAQAEQLRKANEETGQLKQAEAANSAQSLDQERQKAAALAQEAAAARQELTTGTAKHRQALDEERARGAALASELAAAQREIEAQAAQLRKASEETEQLKQAKAANNARSLDQERQKTAALAREAAAARQELTTGTATHRQALDEERTQRAKLWSELAAAQREIETQATQLRKASEETEQLRQAEAANSARSLDQERQKTAALAEVAAARQELTTSTAKHRQALDEERARSAALAIELATAQREKEMQATQLRKASEETRQLRQATESSIRDLRQSLQQERARAKAMAREIESARGTVDVRVTPEATADNSISKAAEVIELAAMTKPAAVDAQGSPEAMRLIVRARVLLRQGNISAARIVLERAAETGSALASFTLAETYDPVILSTWGTYGTRGDTTKARELYAKAHAGGIEDAKHRLDELDQ